MKDVEVIQRASWNNIEYIYKRKIAVEMYKIIKGEEGHRLKRNLYHQTLYTAARGEIRDRKVEI